MLKKIKNWSLSSTASVFNIQSMFAVAFFLVAAFLRLYRIEAFTTFLGDQGRDAIIIKRIITFEHLTAIGAPSSIGQVFLGPFYYYLVAPFLPLFHFNPAGLAFAVAFYSLVGFVAAYMIVKKEINAVAAVFFALLLAFSSVNIELSRFSWNPNLLPVFAFITLYFWYKTLYAKQWYYAFLFGIFFSCSFQLHHLALLMGLPVFVSLIFYLKEQKFSLDIVKKIGNALIGFGILSSPLILFDLKNRFLNTLNLIHTFTEGSIFDDTLHKSVSDRMLDTTSALFQHLFNVQIPPVIALLVFIFFVTLCLGTFKLTKNKFIQLHMMNVVLFTVVFGLLNSARHMHYYGSEYYSIFVVLAYFLYKLQKQNLFRFIFIPLFFGLYIFFNAQHYYFLYREPNNQIKDARTIAESIIPHVDKTPYQIVPLPISVTDGHIRYFLEVDGQRPLDYDSPEQGQELFVMCFYGEKCKVVGNAQWQIAAFSNAKVDTMWKLPLVTIYKLVHGQK